MELIVLNIGLDAGVINDRIFAIMVIMCLVTTFMTSPLISITYPLHHQTTVQEALRARAKKAINKDDMEAQDEQWTSDSFKMLACVDRMEQVPSIVGLASKFQVDSSATHQTGHTATPFSFNVLRLMETSERSSTLFYAASAPGISPAQNDPVLQMMSMFSRLMKITAKCFYAVAPVDAYNEEVDRIAGTEQCNMLLMTVNVDGGDALVESVLKHRTPGLVPVLFVDRKRATEAQVIAYSPVAPNNVMNDAFTIPAPSSAPGSGVTHVLMPFEGGRMDRKALKVALRLSMHPSIHLTVLHVIVVDKSQSGAPIHPSQSQPDAAKPRYGAISYISNKLHSDPNRVRPYARTGDKDPEITTASFPARGLRRRNHGRGQARIYGSPTNGRRTCSHYNEHPGLRRRRMQATFLRFGRLGLHFGTEFRMALQRRETWQTQRRQRIYG